MYDLYKEKRKSKEVEPVEKNITVNFSLEIVIIPLIFFLKVSS